MTAIVVTGGFWKGKSSYKYEEEKWIKLNKLPNKRWGHNSIEVGCRSFIIGGFNCIKISEYKNGKFEQVAEMEDKLMNFAVCKFDEHNLLIGGGWNGSKTYKICNLFNINTYKFSSIADMKQARKNFAIVECNQKFYAIGGKYNNSIECYNKKTNKWSRIIGMKYTRWFHQATTYNKNIYIFGGCRGNERWSNKIDVLIL